MTLTAPIRQRTRRQRFMHDTDHRSRAWRDNPPVHRSPSTITPKPEDLSRSSDEELLSRYRDHHRPEEFNELVRRYTAQLGRFLARYLGNLGLAEDVLQDTFLQIHAKCRHYGDGWPARPWLYAVATHRAIDTLRRAKRSPISKLETGRTTEEPDSLVQRLASAEPGPLERLEDQETRQWVRKSMAQLPEPMRQALALAYDRELSYAQIADLTGVPIGTVKSRLHNAISRLREMADRAEPTGSR